MITTSSQYSFWMAMAHIGGWSTEKINRLIIKIIHDSKLTFNEFFELGADKWATDFNLENTDISKLNNLRKELPNYSFLTEDLLEQGFNIIPLNSPDYPRTLGNNLKVKYSPTVLYTKGNTELLQHEAVAIVGSRKASQRALEFTEARARIAVEEGKLIVSGFAHGVDRYALDSAIRYKGQSIIVLPQGIMTFSSGYKHYYQQIYEGDVLILSIFHPKSSWTPQLAMSRNPIIYGLVKEIFVAECQEKGGTWSGAIDGLRKKRTIYVRDPLPDENNANKLLIGKGAVPIDTKQKIEQLSRVLVTEKMEFYRIDNSVDEEIVIEDVIKEKVILLLSKKSELTASEIIERAALQISPLKLIHQLKRYPEIDVLKSKGKSLKFSIKRDNIQQTSLF